MTWMERATGRFLNCGATLGGSETRTELREREPRPGNTQYALDLYEELIDVATGQAQPTLMIRVERIFRVERI
jgi:hypothetical protein